MSINNLFLVPAIFKEPDRVVISENITEQDILDAYLNITYPSLKKYAEFYNYDFKFGKKLYFEDQDIKIRKKIWYSKWYNLKEHIQNYNNVILCDFDIIIKKYSDIHNIKEIGVITKEKVDGQYKPLVDYIANVLQKEIKCWYKSTFVYIPNIYKKYFIDEMETTLESFVLKKHRATDNDEIFLNYVLHKYDLPTFKVNRKVYMLHYGGSKQKRKLIQLNEEYFKFKKYFSYL